MHFSFLFWRRQVFEVDREVNSATSRSRTLLMQDECQHGTVTLNAHQSRYSWLWSYRSSWVRC